MSAFYTIAKTPKGDLIIAPHERTVGLLLEALTHYQFTNKYDKNLMDALRQDLEKAHE